MHRTLRHMLLAGSAAFALAMVLPSAAPADDLELDDDYWEDYWDWYDNDFRRYYRPNSYYDYGYGNNYGYWPYYGGYRGYYDYYDNDSPNYYGYRPYYGYGYPNYGYGYYGRPNVGVGVGGFGFRLWY